MLNLGVTYVIMAVSGNCRKQFSVLRDSHDHKVILFEFLRLIFKSIRWVTLFIVSKT